MDIVISIAAKIAEYTVRPTIRQFGYLIHYNHNIKDLEENVKNLENFKNELQRRVDEAKRNAEEIEVMVNEWLKNVIDIIQEFNNQFHENGVETEKTCLKFVRRHRLSRNATKLTKRVLQIKEEGRFERVSYRLDPQKFVSLIDGESTCVNFKSRNSTKENIMKALKKDSNNNIIGVYGMGGVGKTEFVKEILKCVKEAKLFNIVVMTTISQDPNVRKIQGEIGDMLGLRFEEESIQGRALKLLKRLQDENSILIVLDDVWKFLDLKTVGIPRNGCKILLTSRDKHMLFNDMDVEMNFELNALDNEESWNFFKKVIDITAIEENSDLELIAHQVANECSGLPIALVTVAKALRGKSLAIWEDALDQLKNSKVDNITGMNEKVYSSLELSYNFLTNDQTKKLFLFCSMYPEDHDIEVEDDLLRYVVGMRLLASHDTMTKTRNRVMKLISDLKSSSLLLESEREGHYVKMHDVIRDFARSFVLKREEMSIIRNNNVIFTRCEDFDDLSRKFKFSELELLVLTSDLTVPQAFLNGMDRIKVLGFEGKCVYKLPSSICSLTNLRTLSLLDCTYLTDIDLIHDLKELEILSVRKSLYMKELPLIISQFTQLTVLDLSDCWKLVISPNIISSLTNLEELDLKNSFREWEGEFINNKKEKASLSELKCLPRLATLRTCIQNEKILSEQIFSKGAKLERFEIIIGEAISNLTKKERYCSKALTLNLNSRIVFSNDLKILMKSAEEMLLKGLIGENDAFSKFGEFHHLQPQLKHLRIYDNSDIDHIISDAEPYLFRALAALESLHLQGMRNLEHTIYSDTIIPKDFCFKKLRIIKVKSCHKMRNILSLSFINCFQNLQRIKVEDCQIMEGVVAMENQADKLQLHQLKSLTLKKLPKFTSFQQFDIIEEGETSNNFKPLFREQDEFTNLEELKVIKVENLEMIWHHDKSLIKDSFTKLKEIKIENCESLSKVFSYNVIKALKALEKVIIQNCDSLEEIFEIKNMNPPKEEMVKMPLKLLHLYGLPNLKHVWNEDPQKISLTFPTLQEVKIQTCPKLKSHVFPVSFTKCNLLRQLHSLRIYNCAIQEIFAEDNNDEAMLPNSGNLMIEKADNLKTIWQNELIVDPFGNLQSIKIFHCKSLRNIFPSNSMKAFGSLKTLKVEVCESLEEIFRIDEKEITSDDIVLEAKLERLVLRNLPKLNHVWSKDGGKFLVYQKLKFVKVTNCSKITSVFPASFAKYLPQQLVNLKIQCSRLEEVFEKQEMLEKESFFLKVSFSNLEVLKLECHERAMRIVEHINSPRKLFPKLKKLRLIGVHFQLTIDKIKPKVEKIEIENNMFVKKLFSENHKSETLERLELENLPKLMNIWKLKENYDMIKPSLSLINFQNLVYLSIDKCHGLTNLLPCSVVKSLVQLKWMYVNDCKNMTSIIGEEEEEETEIVFSKFQWFELCSLPRLEAFHLGKCRIKFPCLCSIKISECVSMKTFSVGMMISSRELQRLWLSLSKPSTNSESPLIWLSKDSDINAIIRKCWEENDLCPNLFQEEEEMELAA